MGNLFIPNELTLRHNTAAKPKCWNNLIKLGSNGTNTFQLFQQIKELCVEQQSFEMTRNQSRRTLEVYKNSNCVGYRTAQRHF